MNKEMLVKNWTEKSLTSQSLTHDVMKASGGEVEDFVFAKALIHAKYVMRLKLTKN